MLHMKTFLSGRSSGTVRGLACAAGLIALTTAGYCAYRRLKRISDLRAPEREAAQGSVLGVDVEEVLVCTEEVPQTSAVVLVTETNPQLLDTSLDPEKSAVILSLEVHRYIACFVRGPEVLLWWITTTTKMSSNHWGAFNATTRENSITCIQRVCGSVRALVSCHHEETTIHVPFEDGEQTIYQESDVELPPEEQEVPFISLYLTGRGITDLVLKLPAVREAFSLDGGFLQHVFDMNSQWDVDIREPEAEQLFLLLSLKLTMLLEELFSQSLDLYSDPAALATAVQRLVKERVQEMLKAMEGV
ncbi:hypothetical protein Q7C36_021746 [Tachysurus vachellii]|uniref:Uncharacterized protein n=1 Tax=Tachysurus vachellii TaxID=175792 RepID=A0AA88IPS1_TACVA|nr:hypothetical protein Q7C36_021746 [Tachysurus vachellii]